MTSLRVCAVLAFAMMLAPQARADCVSANNSGALSRLVPLTSLAGGAILLMETWGGGKVRAVTGAALLLVDPVYQVTKNYFASGQSVVVCPSEKPSQTVIIIQNFISSAQAAAPAPAAVPGTNAKILFKSRIDETGLTLQADFAREYVRTHPFADFQFRSLEENQDELDRLEKATQAKNKFNFDKIFGDQAKPAPDAVKK